MTQVTTSKIACQLHRTSRKSRPPPEIECQARLPKAGFLCSCSPGPSWCADRLLLKRQVEPETQAQTLSIPEGGCLWTLRCIGSSSRRPQVDNRRRCGPGRQQPLERCFSEGQSPRQPPGDCHFTQKLRPQPVFTSAFASCRVAGQGGVSQNRPGTGPSRWGWGTQGGAARRRRKP